MPLHLFWHTNVIKGGYFGVIIDSDSYKKIYFGFTHMKLETIDF